MSTRERCAHCGCVPITTELLIHDVREIDGGWEVAFGPDAGDAWVTVHEEDFPCEPEIGDIATVQPPHVLALVTP